MPDLPDSGSASSPATISGRRITVVVLVTLLLTGLLFYWIATSYGTYNAARRQTDRTWRALAVVLDKRYRQYDAQVALASDQAKIGADEAKRWKAARDNFSRTILTAHQIQAAQNLEETIATLPESFRLPEADPPELQELYGNYAAAAQTQRAVGQSAGSRLLKLMLRLPDPPEFSLAD